MCPNSIPFKAENIPFFVSITFSFIFSSIDGHSGCFYPLGIVNNAAISAGVHISVLPLLSIPFGICSEVELLCIVWNSHVYILKNHYTAFHSTWTTLYSYQHSLLFGIKHIGDPSKNPPAEPSLFTEM